MSAVKRLPPGRAPRASPRHILSADRTGHKMPENVMIRVDQEFVTERRVGPFANRPASIAFCLNENHSGALVWVFRPAGTVAPRRAIPLGPQVSCRRPGVIFRRRLPVDVGIPKFRVPVTPRYTSSRIESRSFLVIVGTTASADG